MRNIYRVTLVVAYLGLVGWVDTDFPPQEKKWRGQNVTQTNGHPRNAAIIFTL